MAGFTVGGVSYTMKPGWTADPNNSSRYVYKPAKISITPVTTNTAKQTVVSNVFAGDPVAIKQGGIDKPSGIPSVSSLFSGATKAGAASSGMNVSYIIVGVMFLVVALVFKSILGIFR